MLQMNVLNRKFCQLPWLLCPCPFILEIPLYLQWTHLIFLELPQSLSSSPPLSKTWAIPTQWANSRLLPKLQIHVWCPRTLVSSQTRIGLITLLLDTILQEQAQHTFSELVSFLHVLTLLLCSLFLCAVRMNISSANFSWQIPHSSFHSWQILHSSFHWKLCWCSSDYMIDFSNRLIGTIITVREWRSQVDNLPAVLFFGVRMPEIPP